MSIHFGMNPPLSVTKINKIKNLLMSISINLRLTECFHITSPSVVEI